MDKKDQIVKLSIVIPVLNGEQYLAECLASICQQKGEFAVEILVEDGQSTDGTLQIADEFRNKAGSQIEWHINSQTDQNLYEAIHRGIQKSTGDIVTWISATDFYLPHAFSTVVDIMSQHESVNWLSGIPLTYNEKGQAHYFKTPVFYSNQLIRQGFYNGKRLHFIQQESCFMRKSALDKLDLEQIMDYPHAGDQKLWNMLSRNEDLYLVYSFLAGSRQHAHRVSSESEYHLEFEELSDNKTLGAMAFAFLQYIATYFFPEKFKKMMAPRSFEFRKGRWRL